MSTADDGVRWTDPHSLYEQAQHSALAGSSQVASVAF
jgi:hypothetical protein